MLQSDEQAGAERYLDEVAKPLVKSGFRVKARSCLGSPAKTILQEARASGAALVTMATQGRTGIREVIMGSVAHEVLRRDSRRLLLVRPDENTVGSRS